MNTVIIWNQADLPNPDDFNNLCIYVIDLLWKDGVVQGLPGWPIYSNLIQKYISWSINSNGVQIIIDSQMTLGYTSTLISATLADSFYKTYTTDIQLSHQLYQIYYDNSIAPLSIRKLIFYAMVNGWPNVGTITTEEQAQSWAINAVFWVNANFPNFQQNN